MFLGTELVKGKSVEHALYEAIKKHGEKNEKILEKIAQYIQLGMPFERIMEKTIKTKEKEDDEINGLDENTKKVLEITQKIIKNNPKKAGETLIRLSTKIDENKKHRKRRETMIKAEKTKATITIFITFAIMGLLAGITPLLTLATTITKTNPQNYRTIVTQTVIQKNHITTLTLLITTIITAYYTGKITMTEKPWKNILIGTLLFLIIYQITTITIAKTP
ncbi:MAG: hypothetical protein ACFE68_07255 [Candidatus Hodarchaeota archaeon]